MSAKARALRATGVRVLDFTVGEPDQPTPPHVVEAGRAAIEAGRTKYAPASGLPELRAAVVHRYREDFQVAFAPEEVTVTVGGKQALALLYQAVLDPKSEVVVPIPAWPTFAEAARVAGATPVFVPLVERTGFRLTARAVAKALTPRTRAVVVNSPSASCGGSHASPGRTASGSSTTTPTPTSSSAPGGRPPSRR
jgi:aspartate aminotransferase